MSKEATQSSGNPNFSINSSPNANTPTVMELEEILRQNRVPLSRIDEVWPNLYIGDMTIAHDRFRLWKLGITHVLNTAHKQVASSGCQDFYGTSMDYYGIAARDVPNFDIAAYFYSASDYIHKALDILGGNSATTERTNNPMVMELKDNPDTRRQHQCKRKMINKRNKDGDNSDSSNKKQQLEN
ncbi:dual specificity protein phosphatase 13-like isoform X2 [Chiloscyllium plagiosum]|uniref:dual specificity protein phosphatase 13-like isoform X2 n=1 Tax=Chiloscyllium plagiosum TaxID=36176 RepID=UPI001CB86726|nr:dual specificity protein phosphatase 13-like isoform X2 [Chiloscyllium plagiosum]